MPAEMFLSSCDSEKSTRSPLIGCRYSSKLLSLNAETASLATSTSSLSLLTTLTNLKEPFAILPSLSIFAVAANWSGAWRSTLLSACKPSTFAARSLNGRELIAFGSVGTFGGSVSPGVGFTVGFVLVLAAAVVVLSGVTFTCPPRRAFTPGVVGLSNDGRLPTTGFAFGVGRTCGVLISGGVFSIGDDGIPGAIKPLFSDASSDEANWSSGFAIWK